MVLWSNGCQGFENASTIEPLRPGAVPVLFGKCFTCFVTVIRAKENILDQLNEIVGEWGQATGLLPFPAQVRELQSQRAKPTKTLMTKPLHRAKNSSDGDWPANVSIHLVWRIVWLAADLALHEQKT
jgi:hypothetical protein